MLVIIDIEASMTFNGCVSSCSGDLGHDGGGSRKNKQGSLIISCASVLDMNFTYSRTSLIPSRRPTAASKHNREVRRLQFISKVIAIITILDCASKTWCICNHMRGSFENALLKVGDCVRVCSAVVVSRGSCFRLRTPYVSMRVGIQVWLRFD